MELNFFPTNKHLLLEPIVEQEKKESKKSKLNIIIPEDDAPQKECLSSFGVFKVKKVALGSSLQTLKDKTVVVDNHMVQKIVVDNKEYFLILENYVLGFFMVE